MTYVSNEEMVELRAKLAREGHMTGWPTDAKYRIEAGYPPSDVQLHCVQHAAWQRLRMKMKGKATHQKLAMCKEWWDAHSAVLECADYATKCQVGNYLGALRRGGQLDMNNQIRKYI